ncbi:6085_t:CDS:2 [Dentiscutata erythropus]|uniref:6085_t:CDS:1 n=1 Tax=Dentiscutata erythropus TaxID=1348616 RepID=A0A9N9FMK9_9GLOM|nr:6085_t:CDS:2 [Dentiscutata erythropus]
MEINKPLLCQIEEMMDLCNELKDMDKLKSEYVRMFENSYFENKNLAQYIKNEVKELKPTFTDTPIIKIDN